MRSAHHRHGPCPARKHRLTWRGWVGAMWVDGWVSRGIDSSAPTYVLPEHAGWMAGVVCWVFRGGVIACMRENAPVNRGEFSTLMLNLFQNSHMTPVFRHAWELAECISDIVNNRNWACSGKTQSNEFNVNCCGSCK